MTHGVVLPPAARLQFNHSFDFENGPYERAANFDGGVIEYSIDNGATWSTPAASSRRAPTYGGADRERTRQPESARAATPSSKESFGYTATQLNLASLAGQNVRFRFRIGTDESVGDYGWFIDDVRIYTCVASVPHVQRRSARGPLGPGEPTRHRPRRHHQCGLGDGHQRLDRPRHAGPGHPRLPDRRPEQPPDGHTEYPGEHPRRRGRSTSSSP